MQAFFSKQCTRGKRFWALLLCAVMLIGIIPTTTAFAASWLPTDEITITVDVFDNYTNTIYRNVATDTITKGDEKIQSDNYRIKNLSVLVPEAEYGRITQVTGNWYGVYSSCNVGTNVTFSCNSDTARITYWVNGWKVGSGETSSDKEDLGGGGKYQIDFSIVYHSNYPDGTDYTVTKEYTVKNYTTIYTVFASQFKSYSEVGFGGYTPKTDGNTWYRTKNCTEKAGTISASNGETYHLYAGWETESATGITLTYKSADGSKTYGTVDTFANAEITIAGTDSFTPAITNGEAEFLGWAETANATTAIYKAGQQITLTGSKTLYAVWSEPTPETYTISFDITKSVVKTGDLAPESVNTFSFVVSDESGMTFANPTITVDGVGTGTATVTLNDLTEIPKILYVREVTENVPSGWTYDTATYMVTFTVATDGVIIPIFEKITSTNEAHEKADNIALTNTYYAEAIPDPDPEYGNLIVSKTVSGSGASTSKAFTFTVTLNDTSINGTYGDMTFENGVATFTLKADERKTANNLPAGTSYTVVESDNDGYTVTVNNTEQTTATGTIFAGETAIVAFNNYKSGGGSVTPDPDPDGSVKITKTVQGNKAPAEKVAYEFKVWVRNSSGNAVSERVSYKFTANGTTTNSNSLTIGADGYTFYLKDGESITFSDITSGRRIEVKEITTGDFTTTTSGLTDGVCVISSNTTKTVAFVNDYGNTNTPGGGDDKDPTDPVDPTTPTEPADDPTTPTEPADDPTTPTTPDRSLDDVPQTGDNSNMGLWIALASLSLFCMAALTFGKKRFIARSR